MNDFQCEFFPVVEAVIFEEPKLDSHSKSIHETAIRRAKTYLVAEAALLESIIEIDRDRTFEKFGETYLTPYCVKFLGLTSDVAANFVRVARKSEQVPELKEAISQGDLTVTKAKSIASVITPSNQEQWIEKAKTLSKEKLEQEVAKASPQAAKPEKAKPVRADIFRIEFEFTLDEMNLLRRAQDIVSQSLGHSASIAETQREALKLFLHYRDPLKKAARAKEKAQRKRNSADEINGKSDAAEIKENDLVNKGKGEECSDKVLTRNLESSKQWSRGCSTIKQVSLRNETKPVKVQRYSGKKKARQYPAELIHALNLRDKGLCQAQKPDGSICGATRWVQFHHLLEVENGGEDSLENMITLCGSHHRAWHRRRR